jgi:hypothetical protein
MDFQPKFQQKKWRHDPLSDNFTQSKLFGALPPITVKTLDRPLAPVFNQGSTTRCSAYGSTTNHWYRTFRNSSPDWKAHKIGQKQGRSVDNYGADPNSTMKSDRDDGYLLIEDAYLSLEKDGVEGSGYGKWSPSLDVKAVLNDDISGFIKIDNKQQDYFDACKAALFRAYDPVTKQGACVDIFSGWYPNWYGETLTLPSSSLSGYHRTVLWNFDTTYKGEYLLLQNSYGESIGNKGIQAVPRDVINWEFSQSGRSLKQLVVLTPAMIAEARKQTPLGAIIRQFILLWQNFSDVFGK